MMVISMTMWFVISRPAQTRPDRKVLIPGLVRTAKMTHNPVSIVGLLYDARLGSATAGVRTSGRATDLRFSGQASENCPAWNREAEQGGSPSWASGKRSGFS